MKLYHNKSGLVTVDSQSYVREPDRYELRHGSEPLAPSCPYGNRYKFIGFDKISKEYVRLSKSVFKKLVVGVLYH